MIDTAQITEGVEDKVYSCNDIREISKTYDVTYLGGNNRHFFTVRNGKTEHEVVVQFSSTTLNQVYENSKPDSYILACLRYIIEHYERLK